MAKTREITKRRFGNVITIHSPSNKCEGCGAPAKYIVHGQPHCEKHMIEAMCGVDTAVRTIDGDYDDAS